jgi:hypothetical protein
VPLDDWLVAPYSLARISSDKSLYVLGRDRGVDFDVALPPACAGRSFAVRLCAYPDPGVGGGIQAMTEPGLANEVRSVVPAGGTRSVSFLLPATASTPMRVRPGLLSSCLSGIAVQGGLNLGLLAPPGDADVSNLEVSGKMLDVVAVRGGQNGVLQTAGEFFGGELTASVDGYACETVSVVDPLKRNARGNVEFRVGAADQPAPCSEIGREVVFIMTAKGDGTEALAGAYQTVPEVIQLVDNLGPLPPGTPARPPLINQ